MIKMTEENIIAALQSEHMDRTATYIQNGRNLSGFDLDLLETSLIEILMQLHEDQSNRADTAIASWIMVELEIRGESQEPFLTTLSKCVQNIPIHDYPFTIAITDSVEKFLYDIEKKN